MTPVLAFAGDAIAFVLVPLGVWRLLGGRVPIVVVSIGLGLGWRMLLPHSSTIGAPSMTGSWLGWAGVLALAFMAGLETRQAPHDGAIGAVRLRLIASAGLALALPFAATMLAAYLFLASELAPALRGTYPIAITASAIGLCGAVSALPVLIGLVRELSDRRDLGQLALSLSVIDDAALWVGLALVQIAADSGAKSTSAPLAGLAVAALLLLALIGRITARDRRAIGPALAWPTAIAAIAVGSWATWQLGLHEIVGAYLAGLMFPTAWRRTLDVQRLSGVALMIFAPFLFGHSAFGVPADAIDATTVGLAFGLMFLCATTKLAAILLIPPDASLPFRDRLALGALLQCKGLMEIVAATLLCDLGIITPRLFPVFVILAALSTISTKPLFRAAIRTRAPNVRTDVAVGQAA